MSMMRKAAKKVGLAVVVEERRIYFSIGSGVLASRKHEKLADTGRSTVHNNHPSTYTNDRNESNATASWFVLLFKIGRAHV